MTEDEARQTECWQWVVPFDTNTPYKPLCTASSCMAWVWDDKKENTDYDYLSEKYVNQGHCGLVRS